MNNKCSLVLIFVSLLKKGPKRLKHLMSLILLPPPPALAWLPHPAPSPPASRLSPALILPGFRPPDPLHYYAKLSISMTWSISLHLLWSIYGSNSCLAVLPGIFFVHSGSFVSVCNPASWRLHFAVNELEHDDPHDPGGVKQCLHVLVHLTISSYKNILKTPAAKVYLCLGNWKMFSIESLTERFDMFYNPTDNSFQGLGNLLTMLTTSLPFLVRGNPSTQRKLEIFGMAFTTLLT